MNQQVAKLWVEALRSGKYKQGKRRLHERVKTEDGKVEDYFCCLGVLCDIAPKAFRTDDGTYAGGTLSPQYDVQEWAEIQSSVGKLHRCLDFQSSLAAINDEGGTFEEIAVIIEKNWEDL